MIKSRQNTLLQKICSRKCIFTSIYYSYNTVSTRDINTNIEYFLQHMLQRSCSTLDSTLWSSCKTSEFATDSPNRIPVKAERKSRFIQYIPTQWVYWNLLIFSNETEKYIGENPLSESEINLHETNRRNFFCEPQH